MQTDPPGATRNRRGPASKSPTGSGTSGAEPLLDSVPRWTRSSVDPSSRVAPPLGRWGGSAEATLNRYSTRWEPVFSLRLPVPFFHMLTVMDALRWANARLRENAEPRFDSPMLDAEILLASVLGIPKVKLFLRGTSVLSDRDFEQFRVLVERRAAREPVAYILGQKEFYGRSFAVNRFTLVPRPATETLVESAVHIAQETDPAFTILADVGTGSGAIAVTLAAETGLPVIASDVSRHALTVARTNAESLAVSAQVDFRQGEGLDPLTQLFRTVRATQERLPFSHLVLCANLPYLPDARWEELQGDIQRHEPRLALTSGPDGLADYWKLFRDLKDQRNLFPSVVSALIEIDPDQTDAAVAMIRHRFPQAQMTVQKDLEGHDRVVIARGL